MNAIEELKKIIPAKRVIAPGDSLYDSYIHDWTGHYLSSPLAVLLPETTHQVREIVLWARKNKTPLVAASGRTGLSGGIQTQSNEILLSLEKLNHLGNFNPTDFSVHCGAGVTTETLQEFAKQNGAYFPIDLSAKGSSQLGGNIATNVGGVHVIRYGLMRNWVSHVTAVTGTGEVLELNHGLIKNATGYDLRHLLIGSEGTLAIITEATIQFTRAPKETQVLLLGSDNLQSVLKAFHLFKSETKLMAFEIFNEDSLQIVLKSHSSLKSPLNQNSKHTILVELEVENSLDEENVLKVFEEATESGFIQDGVISQSETQKKEFWALRENISESISQYMPYKNDISVLPSKIPTFVSEFESLLAKHYPDFSFLWFGHVGDGNLHINILKPDSLDKDAFQLKCETVTPLLFDLIKKHNGSISAEHGVGLLKKPYLNYSRSQVEIQIMKEIKKVFDPDCILNPGKLI